MKKIVLHCALFFCCLNCVYPQISKLDPLVGKRNLGSGFIYIGSLNDHDYYKSTATYLWNQADSLAVSLGGHLVSIADQTENDFIYANGLDFSNDPLQGVWTGFNDEAIEGTFVWANGEPVTYTNWNEGEPNNGLGGGEEDHVEIVPWNGKWNDQFNTDALQFILEFEPGALTVSLTTPTNNATYVAPANIKLTATASDADGTITKVEFYNDTTLLHTATVAPNEFMWNDVPEGNYTLTAKVYDNAGRVTTSAAIHISVVPNSKFTQTVISPFNTDNFRSIVIDYNNDGLDDIVGCKTDVSRSAKLYKNNGNSTFSDVSTSMNFPAHNRVIPVGELFQPEAVARDFDKNGLMDIYYQSVDTLRISFNRGTSFSTPTVDCGLYHLGQLFNTASSNIDRVRVFDYNGDGIYDIIASINNGETSSIVARKGQLNGTTCGFSFRTDTLYTLVSVNNTHSSDFQFADIDNDGDFDLLWSSSISDTYDQFFNCTYSLYLNNNNTFTFYPNSGYSIGRANGFGVLGEFNNDGKTDILSGAADCCEGDNPLYVYFSTDSLGFNPSTTAIQRKFNPYYGIPSVVDINLDKKQDIVFTDIGAYTGSSALQCFLNNGNNTFIESASLLGINYGSDAGGTNQRSTILDLNNDKKPDLDIHEIDRQAPYDVVDKWQLLNTSTNNAVKLKLSACKGLKEGWGARIKYKTGGTWTYLQHTAYASSNYPFLYLGMGISTLIDTIVVNWIGGATTVRNNVASGSYIVMEESSSCSSTPPTVNLTTPTNNTIRLAPAAHIKLSAAAFDADGTISKVEFYNGTHLLHTENVIPYGFVWRNVPLGNYTLTAKAYDNDGIVTTSAPVHISVVPNKPPVVSIINPKNNETFAASTNIQIEADAKDSDGRMTRVEFYSGSTLLNTQYQLPYRFVWKDVPAGTYTITAVARDNWGARTTSAPVTIAVKSNTTIVSSKANSTYNKTGVSDAVSLTLSPNPANTIVNLYTTGLQQDKQATIRILSASGVAMKTMQLNSSAKAIQLNVSSLVGGVYTIQLVGGNKVLYKQFVKL